MWYRNPLVLVYVISFVDLFAIGLTFPLMSTHLRSLGASHTFVGLLMSTYSGIQVLSGPVVGGWTDVRDRKTVLKKILLLCGLCYGALGLTNSFVIIFIIRVVLGCVKHIQSICRAVISDLIPIKDQTGAFGNSNAVSSLGFILGPFIGGHLGELSNGFSYVCLLTMVLFFVNIGVVSLLPETSRKKNDNILETANVEADAVHQIRNEFTKTLYNLKSINWSKFWEPFCLRFLFGLATSTYFSNQALILREKYLLSQKHIGYVISFFSIVGLVSSFSISKINVFYKNNDCLTKILHFFILMAVCVVGLFVSPNFYVLLTLLVPFSLASTVLRIMTMELILLKTSELHRGSLSGASNSIMSISRFVTPIISGILSDKFGEQNVILVAVIPATIGVFLCLHLKLKQT